MKYNFLRTDGKIIKTNGLNTIKEGLTLESLNRLKPLWKIQKEENEFLKRYGLINSIFNIAVLQHLNLVYLFSNDLKRIEMKGGLN